MIFIFTKFRFLTLLSIFSTSLRTDNLGESDVETLLDGENQGSLLDRPGFKQNDIEKDLR